MVTRCVQRITDDMTTRHGADGCSTFVESSSSAYDKEACDPAVQAYRFHFQTTFWNLILPLVVGGETFRRILLSADQWFTMKEFGRHASGWKFLSDIFVLNKVRILIRQGSDGPDEWQERAGRVDRECRKKF